MPDSPVGVVRGRQQCQTRVQPEPRPHAGLHEAYQAQDQSAIANSGLWYLVAREAAGAIAQCKEFEDHGHQKCPPR